jgi:N-acetylmuramoyl-L-alanine amidase
VAAWSVERRHRLTRTLTVAGLAVGCVAGALYACTPRASVLGVALTRPSTSHPAPSVDGTPVNSALFAPGSCIALAPTSGDRHLTVFLDAGHGGPDPGGQGVTQSGAVIHERELTLPVVLDAARLLRADGFRVVVSRTTNGPVVKLAASDLSGGLLSVAGEHRDTAARPLCADKAGAALLVSVHFNVGSSPANAGALATYDAARPFASRNHTLATLLQTDIVKAFAAQHGWQIPNDGVVTDDTVGNALTSAGAAYGHLLVLGPAKAGYFTTPSTMPGALVEPLFLTDPFEGTIAASARGQLIMAKAITAAITTFVGPR